MEVTANKDKVNQGRNIRLARTWRGVTQEWLADEIRVSQKQISAFEGQQTVEDVWLDKIAESLNVPVDFLKTFQIEEPSKSFVNSNNDITNDANSEQDSKGTILQSQGVAEQENVINNNYPISEIKDLYGQIMAEKDKQIARFEKEVDELKKQIQELMNKIG